MMNVVLKLPSFLFKWPQCYFVDYYAMFFSPVCVLHDLSMVDWPGHDS